MEAGLHFLDCKYMKAIDKVKTSLIKSGITKKELADQTGFTLQYIDMILSGRRELSLSFLAKVLPVLRKSGNDPGLNVDDLIRSEQNK